MTSAVRKGEMQGLLLRRRPRGLRRGVRYVGVVDGGGGDGGVLGPGRCGGRLRRRLICRWRRRLDFRLACVVDQGRGETMWTIFVWRRRVGYVVGRGVFSLGLQTQS